MTIENEGVSSDHSKIIGEWAISAGRLFQSEQTGFVHLFGGSIDQENAKTIPVYENTLFALALLRSRTVEHAQEAKGLLKKLLAFQNFQNQEYQGNFPTYLHDYPTCKDHAVGLLMLAPFYWILKQFGHVLGSELRKQLEEASHLSLQFSLQSNADKPFPYSLAVRLAVAQINFASMHGDLKSEEEGKDWLKKLAAEQLTGWYSTKHLGDILVAVQSIYPSLINSPWKSLWDRLEQTWHFQTASYIGPCIREWQEKEEPQSNLYDLYGGYFAGKFSRRVSSQLRPYHLEGALIQPSPDHFAIKSSFSIEGQLDEQKWNLKSFPELAFTLLEKKESYHPTVDKTITPFRMVWGDEHQTHTLVCQGGNYEKVQYKIEANIVNFVFDLKDQLNAEEYSPQREIEFFIDFHPDVFFKINQLSTTTFELGREIILSLGKHQISIIFRLLEGEGHFLGHIMRGNRPSQVDLKKDKRFQSFDWTFFLKTIRRNKSCRIQMTLTFLNREESIF